MGNISGERSVEIDAPMQRCYEITSDIANAPEWQGSLKDVEVLERDGPLHILEAPPPDDVAPEEAGWLDALKGWILAHLPGRTARALRIALGDTEG